MSPEVTHIIPLPKASDPLHRLCFAASILAERNRRKNTKRRLCFSGISDPRQVEPAIREALSRVCLIHGSKIRPKAEKNVVDVLGESIASAGDALQLLEKANIDVLGDVSCEEI